MGNLIKSYMGSPSLQNGYYTNAAFTCNLSTIDGTAFITNPSVDLRSFVGRKITLTSGGKTLVGWVKAEGTGETLSEVELVTDGGAELDEAWTNEYTPIVNERSSAKFYTGAYSRHFTGDAVNDGIKPPSINTTTGVLYRGSSYIYPDDSTGITIVLSSAGDVSPKFVAIALVQDTWNYSIIYYTAAATGAVGYFRFRQNSSGTLNYYIDNVSLKQVLTPSLTGVTIVSTKNGSTYNWTSNDGINANAASFALTVSAN